MTDSDVGTHGEREGREMPSGWTEPDMSDRPDNGGRDGTDDTASPASASSPPASAEPSPPAVPSVDSLLAAAVRGGASADSVGEARAVAAFRAARESGGRTARTRRRDDWRPNARRRVQLSVRTTLAVLLASLTLGGVAFAAIGSATHGDKGADRESGEYGSERPARPGEGASTPPGPADVPRTDPATPESAPAGQGGAARNPDESDRRADRPNDGKATGDSRRQSPRPAEPNGQNGPNEPNEPNEPNGPTGSKVPDEPGRPRVPGGDRPEPTAGDEGRSEGGAPQNSSQNAPQNAPETSPQNAPEADSQAAPEADPQKAPQLAPESGQKARGTK